MTLFTALADVDCQQICGGQYTGDEPIGDGRDGEVVTTTSTSSTCCAWSMSAPGRRLAIRGARGRALGRQSC